MIVAHGNVVNLVHGRIQVDLDRITKVYNFVHLARGIQADSEPASAARRLNLLKGNIPAKGFRFVVIRSEQITKPEGESVLSENHRVATACSNALDAVIEGPNAVIEGVEIRSSTSQTAPFVDVSIEGHGKDFFRLVFLGMITSGDNQMLATTGNVQNLTALLGLKEVDSVISSVLAKY